MPVPSLICIKENSGGSTPSAKPLSWQLPDRMRARDQEASSHSGKPAAHGARRTCAPAARRCPAPSLRERPNPRSTLPSRLRRAIAEPVSATANASASSHGDGGTLIVEEQGWNVAVERHCAITDRKNRRNLPYKGTVMALLFRSSVDSEARWKPQLTRLMPELEVRIWPEIGDPAEIDYALVWRPEPGLLASLPNLKLILSLGAGVDHILCDPELPANVPLVRLVDPYMTDAMSEYVALQVLRLHRQDLDYRAQQVAGIWRELDQKNAAERRVGILGAGALGQDAARKLAALGFAAALWGRSPKTLNGKACYAGAAELPVLLGRSEILVCLLPLTDRTQAILNAGTLALLPRGAALVNAARGGHLVEEDLLAALASGKLSGAVLDVFRDDPLPAGPPFCRHRRVVGTPHVAAATHPPTAAPIILDNIRRFEAGRPLLNRVDPAQGY